MHVSAGLLILVVACFGKRLSCQFLTSLFVTAVGHWSARRRYLRAGGIQRLMAGTQLCSRQHALLRCLSAQAPKELRKLADYAMYAAKKSGKYSYIFASSTDEGKQQGEQRKA